MPIVDARGLLCPLPLTMARQRMGELAAGEALTVLATDPEATIDLAGWAIREGHGYAERPRGEWTEYVLVKLAQAAAGPP